MTKSELLNLIEQFRQESRVTTGTGYEHQLEHRWAILCEVLEALATRNEPAREGDEAHRLVMDMVSSLLTGDSDRAKKTTEAMTNYYIDHGGKLERHKESGR